jgi:hypothetical protein
MNPKHCTEPCKKCINEFDDFGIAAGIRAKSFTETQKCIPVEKLPNELEKCQEGFAL